MKKVLFITYFWPPSGKASVHWPLRMIQHLPHFHWHPLVLTADEDTFSSQDESLVKEVDPHLNVNTARTVEPFRLYRRFLGKEKESPLTASETISTIDSSMRHRIAVWVRMNLFIPDARIGWYWNAVRKGKKILQSESIQAIVSIGPPHTTLLVGKKLSVSFGIPHIPVFIDPWVDISYYRDFERNRITVAIDRHLERAVIEQASRIIFVTESMKEDYEQHYSGMRNKLHVLPWGYDEQVFQTYTPKNSGKAEILLHTGNMYDHQNPKAFWPALQSEIENGRNLKLVFIGTVGPGIRQSIREAGLLPKTEFKGFLPYERLIEELETASYLLVCASEKRHVPGKLFEYLRSGKPILAFGDENKEVQKILTETNAGMIFSLASSGKEFFERAGTFRTNISLVRRFDRKEIASALARILNETT